MTLLLSEVSGLITERQSFVDTPLGIAALAVEWLLAGLIAGVVLWRR